MTDSTIYSDSFFALELRCDVVLANVEQSFAEQIFQLVKTEMEQLENVISCYIPNSSITKLNEAKVGEWISVSNELWNVLTICFDFYQMSNGAFDITATPLFDLWKANENPTVEEIEFAKLKCGFDKVEFDFSKQQIKFLSEYVEFDLEGIAKGIALDFIKPILQEYGISNGIVSFGESSILAIGKHPNGEDWPIGIRNNYNSNDFIHVFLSSNETVITSGSILNSDEGVVNKQKPIVSPVSGLLVGSGKTVSVKSESATMGEFLSTVWLILPENDKTILSEKLNEIEILEIDYLDKHDIKTKLTIL